jgi:hypothetical protein
MFKKRIVIAAITLGLSIPSLGSATPLGWISQLKIPAGIARLWDLLPGMRPGTAAPSARDHRKAGAGHDPNGTPLPPDGGTSQSTTPSDPPPTGQ